MRHVTVGDRVYRISAEARDSRWIARAVCLERDQAFGVECAAANEDDALRRMTLWLAWQHDHARALDSLQQAQRVYHRAMAGVAAAPHDPSALEQCNLALAALDIERIRLDDIRAAVPQL